MSESKEKNDLFGKYTEHLDDGKKIGESRAREGILEDYTEHTSIDGSTTGKSYDREGILGDKYIEHRNTEGMIIGESHEKETILGEKYDIGPGGKGSNQAVAAVSDVVESFVAQKE